MDHAHISRHLRHLDHFHILRHLRYYCAILLIYLVYANFSINGIYATLSISAIYVIHDIYTICAIIAICAIFDINVNITPASRLTAMLFPLPPPHAP